TDPSTLLSYYRELQNEQETRRYSLLAAEKAESKLAFDQAANFYSTAIEVSKNEHELALLHRKRGDALGKAGRGKDAAGAYLQAAQHRSQDDLELRRLAADQFMRSGYF